VIAANMRKKRPATAKTIAPVSIKMSLLSIGDTPGNRQDSGMPNEAKTMEAPKKYYEKTRIQILKNTLFIFTRPVD
jgi:hypothetical protein